MDLYHTLVNTVGRVSELVVAPCGKSGSRGRRQRSREGGRSKGCMRSRPRATLLARVDCSPANPG